MIATALPCRPSPRNGGRMLPALRSATAGPARLGLGACYAAYCLSAVPFVLLWLLIDCLFHRRGR